MKKEGQHAEDGPWPWGEEIPENSEGEESAGGPDTEEVFGISWRYWNQMERGALIQSKSTDNYLRALFGKLDDEPSDLPTGVV